MSGHVIISWSNTSNLSNSACCFGDALRCVAFSWSKHGASQLALGTNLRRIQRGIRKDKTMGPFLIHHTPLSDVFLKLFVLATYFNRFAWNFAFIEYLSTLLTFWFSSINQTSLSHTRKLWPLKIDSFSIDNYHSWKIVEIFWIQISWNYYINEFFLCFFFAFAVF